MRWSRYIFILIGLIQAFNIVQGANSRSVINLPYEPVYGLHEPGTPANTTYALVIDGDTVSLVFLRTIYVLPPERFRSKKEEQFYWRLVRDIKAVYPLSKIVYATLYETMDYLETVPNQKERDRHLKKMEKELLKRYEPTIRKMTYNEGKILLKLIDRQCNTSSFDLIKAYRGAFTAHFWQGIAKLFKADLKSEYDAVDQDYMIERIIIRIDQGQL
jgi:hypothetical protein